MKNYLENKKFWPYRLAHRCLSWNYYSFYGLKIFFRNNFFFGKKEHETSDTIWWPFGAFGSFIHDSKVSIEKRHFSWIGSSKKKIWLISQQKKRKQIKYLTMISETFQLCINFFSSPQWCWWRWWWRIFKGRKKKWKLLQTTGSA